MERKKTPPAYGESPCIRPGHDESLSPMGYELTGPIIVACHWNMLSPVGPALHDAGGSRPRSINSYRGNDQSLGAFVATRGEGSANGQLTLLMRLRAIPKL